MLLNISRWCHTWSAPTDDVSVYSVFTPAWEISHQASTWTPAWWVDSAVAKPGPHLRLICLAVDNNDDVICNLAPCVKYGEGIWLSSLNSFLKPLFAAHFWLCLYKNSQRFPLGISEMLLLPQKFQPPVPSFSKHTSVFLNAASLSNKQPM